MLPATDWFEREDLNTFVQGTQLDPYVQWTGPVVEPAGERRTERAIFAELTERMGHGRAVFGPDVDVLAMLYDGPLAEHGALDRRAAGLRRRRGRPGAHRAGHASSTA